MPRWEPDGAERLQAAALELFDQQGFDQTTVADIANRAGLTQRTFFNHFADKREVLFNLSAKFEDAVVENLSGTGAPSAPLEEIVGALQVATAALFEIRKDTVLRRHRIVERTPELHERELAKQAGLSAAVAAALHRRGLSLDQAQLAAGIGQLVLRTAMQKWAQPTEERSLSNLLARALDDVRVTLAPSIDR